MATNKQIYKLQISVNKLLHMLREIEIDCAVTYIHSYNREMSNGNAKAVFQLKTPTLTVTLRTF